MSVLWAQKNSIFLVLIGKILMQALFSFRRITFIQHGKYNISSNIYLRSFIDNKFAGSVVCYIPWDDNSTMFKQYINCPVGMDVAEPILPIGNHYVQLQLKMGGNDTIFVNGGGKGYGYNNVKIYGFGYKNNV